MMAITKGRLTFIETCNGLASAAASVMTAVLAAASTPVLLHVDHRLLQDVSHIELVGIRDRRAHACKSAAERSKAWTIPIA